MKVKIGDKIYDANEEPIMLIFGTDEERLVVANHIKYMQDGARKYCTYPDTMDHELIRDFMKTE